MNDFIPVCEVFFLPLNLVFAVLESEIDTEPKFVCEVCQPNVAFAENEDFVRHLRDKKIHPEFPGPQIASDFYNKMCSVE